MGDDDDDSNPIIWYLKMPLVTASNMFPGVRSLELPAIVVTVSGKSSS